MVKKILATAAMMAVVGNAPAQNSQEGKKEDADLMKAWIASSNDLKKLNATEQALFESIRQSVLKYEDIYKQMQFGWDVSMMKGADEAKVAKQQIKDCSMKLIDNRTHLMLSACPELKANNVESYVDVLLDNANVQKKFKDGCKLPGNFWDLDDEARLEMVNNRGDFMELVQNTYIINQDILKENFLTPQFLKQLKNNVNRAHIDAKKSPSDVNKQDKEFYLKRDMEAISKLQNGIAMAEKQGVKFNVEDLKQAVVAYSQARFATIDGYDKDNQDKRLLVAESQTKIKESVKNMELAGVAPQAYVYNQEEVQITDSKTISWNTAKALVNEKTQR